MRSTSIVFVLLLALVTAGAAFAAEAPTAVTGCDTAQLATLDLASLLDAPAEEISPVTESEVPEGQQIDLIGGTPCGGVICSGATPECCNASCSRCVPKGWSCTQEACN